MARTLHSIMLGFCLWVCSTASLVAGGATEDITVTQLQVLATSEGQINSAAYMQLENDCRCEDHALTAAYSPVANTVELHAYVNKGGTMEMRRIDEIELVANSKVILEPGGLHVMLIGLKQAINDGDSVPLTLEFEDGSMMELMALAKSMPVMNHE
ncbi:MAG: copper chaperone PCu(A)C [Sedimenticola sp.]